MKMLQREKTMPVSIFLYLQERFPLVSYSILVGLFSWSAMIVFGLQPNREIAWLGGVVMWLAFLHLRIFDEHKDYHKDRFDYPKRILSKGLVRLSTLGRIGSIAIILELVIASLIGKTALLFWSLAFGYSVLMRFEFGIGQWLERRMFLYAITHNPITAFLALFAWACTETAWQSANWWYVLSISLGSLAFEFSRKTNRPEEEQKGVPSYSSVAGLSKTLWIIRVTLIMAIICTVMVLWHQDASIWGWLILLLTSIISLGCTHPSGKAKQFELSGTVFLLLSMLAMIIAPF